MVTLPPAVVLSMVILFCLMGQVRADERMPGPYIGVRLPQMVTPIVPLFEERPFLGLHLEGAVSPLLKRAVPDIRREVKVDSSGRNINFSEKIGKIPVEIPAYLTLEEYARQRQRHNLRSMWQRNTLAKLGERSAYATGSGALRIDIPVEIKSKTFQKIFGSGTVGLDVTGDINIKGGLRHEKRSEVKSTMNQGNDTNFKMEQTQRFRVSGHIGDKVTIGVDQDSERMFDFENNLQLKYKGYEDEIIESIEAGNIALNLPRTNYVTYGGKSSGLFGIKSVFRLGNLSLTAIASQEKGQKKKLDFKGGTVDDVNEIKDYNYVKNVYFFIDELYRRQFPQRGSDGEFLIDPSRRISRIEVYKSKPQYVKSSAESYVHGWAWVPAAADSNKLVIVTGDTTVQDQINTYRGPFLRLEKTSYYVDPELGYIRLNEMLQADEVLAVAFQDTSGRIRGNINFDPGKDRVLQLRLLRPSNPRPTNKTWSLAWRNVYNIGAASESNFELKILYKPSAGIPEETIRLDGKTTSYLQVFGLDRVGRTAGSPPDNIIDKNDNILRLRQGELWFPTLHPFDPDEPEYQALLPEDKRVPAIYDTTTEAVWARETKFVIQVNSKIRKSEISLGVMNVIEGSEEVTLNGRRLQRGTDYMIEYFSGTISIKNQEALQPSANLEITYEANQAFQIDKKTIMGARADYVLWDDSFVGLTFIYLNESTLDQKVRVGKGPMRNMIWDVNSAMSFKPFFLTRFANILPFVDTRDETSLRFEGEVAQIIPNPNTRNNEATGDFDGVAYIDDFEAAKRSTPLGVQRRSWRPASQPLAVVDTTADGDVACAKRGRMIYYQPYTQVSINEIWPNRDTQGNLGTQNSVDVLDIEFTPADTLLNRDGSSAIHESWGGLQKFLSAGYQDQSESKFLEIWVKGSEGNLHIDLGMISEDYIPNRRLDTEDLFNNGLRNNLLDPGEDVGVDGMANNDPRAIAAGGDFWDLNENKVRDWGEPYSNDDWSYSSGSSNHERINGTEGNENDIGGRVPDSEDMNGNGVLDDANAYFSYSFSLSRTSPDTVLVAGKSINTTTGEDFGWRLYRIPLNAEAPRRLKYGDADITNVQYVRLWMDGFSRSGMHFIRIAEVNLVGSEWKEMGVASPEAPETYSAGKDSIIAISVMNTHDNPDYIPPPGVSGEVDRITQVTAREQSLVLNIKEMSPLYSCAIQKSLFEAQDYLHYNTLKMYVYGRDPRGLHISPDSSRLEFFIRFGASTRDYYEIREPVYEGWDPRNNIDIDLQELAGIKLIASNYDSSGYRKGYSRILSSGKACFIMGNPSLTNVRLLIAGVRNLDDTHYFTGQVWMNELRLSNVKKDKGMAFRARAEFNWAGLLTTNAQIERMDSDFHNVTERYGTQNNSTNFSASGTLQLHKFLPAKWGLAIPVSVNYRNMESLPKYKPNTDVEVTDELPEEVLETVRTKSEQKGLTLSLGMNSRSQNFFIKNILNRLNFNYGESRENGSNPTYRITQSRSQNSEARWDVNFSPKNFFRPFKWMGDARWLNKLTDMRLYYTPTNFNTNIRGSRSRSLNISRTDLEQSNEIFTVSSSVGGAAKIVESLQMDLSRTFTNDLQDIARDTLRMMLSNGQLGYLTDMNQNFKISYNPKLFNWLTHNFSYSTTFRYGFNRQQKNQARSAQLGKTFAVNGSLDLRNFWSSIYRAGPVGARPGVRPTQPATRRQAPATPEVKKDDEPMNEKEKGKDKDKEKKEGPGFSVMPVFGKFFGFFEPFSITYNQRNNATIYGISRMPTMRYMLGLADTIGVPMEVSSTEAGTSGTVNRPTRTEGNTVHVSSGFSISRNVKVTLGYDYSYSRNASTTVTGQMSHKRLVYGDIDMPFPEWTVRISGLEKLPFINKYITTMSLDHGYSGTFDQTFDEKNNLKSITKDDRTSKFSPLLGTSLNFKNGITMSVRFTQGQTTSYARGSGLGGTRTANKDLQLSAQYRKQSNFRIPIPVWPFRNMRLKNTVNLQVSMSSRSNTTWKSRQGGDWEPTAETTNWSFKPDLQYSFSDRVNGGAFFEIGKNTNRVIGNSSYYEFGLNANISIRGR